MRKVLLLLLCICMLSSLAKSQQRYQYNPDGKIFLQTDTAKMVIRFKDKRHQTTGRSSFVGYKLSPIDSVDRAIHLLSLQDKLSAIPVNLLSKSRSDTNLLYASPVLRYANGDEAAPTNEILVQTKASSSLSLVPTILGPDRVVSIQKRPFTDNEFIITIIPKPGSDAIDLANKLFESGNFLYSEPNMLHLNALNTSDTYYLYQWSAKNTGTVISGSTAGADMKLESAWAISTGKNIKVAVIDEGVDLVHPDLQANIISGYNVLNNTNNAQPTGNDAHGTAVAGLIGAVANNSLGIAGGAYDCRIIPVKAGQGGTFSDNDLANAVNWAYNNGADVINMSLGGGSASSALNNAIHNAVTLGRAGKGTVICVSSGNENTVVSYPASNAETIAVGASTPCDTRKRSGPGAVAPVVVDPAGTSCDGEYFWGSNYGAGLDVVAPGVKMSTLDISGTSGYSALGQAGPYNSDYISAFNGTSSACPMASALVALVLSVNPALTISQVRQIIESTTDKIGGYTYGSNSSQPNGTWCNDAGYGRINAWAAVSKAFATLPILGNDVNCTASQNYTVASNVNPSAVSWSFNGSASVGTLTSSGLTATVTRGTQGDQSIIRITCNACKNTENVARLISLGPAPPLSVTGFIDLTGFAQPMFQSYNVQLPPGQSATGYNWYLENVFKTTTSTNDVHFPIAPLNYCDYPYFVVGVSINTACGTSAKVTGNITSPRDGCGAFLFQVSPNPASSNVSINMVYNQNASKENLAKINEPFDVILYDQNQNIVRQIKMPAGTTRKNLDVSGLRTGIYYLRVGNSVENHSRAISIVND